MLARNITSCLLLHIILDACSLSARSCLTEVLRILCLLTWNTVRRNSHIKLSLLPFLHKLLKLCLPAENELRIQLTDNMLTFSTPSRLNVACNSPLFFTNGTSYATLQVSVKNVKLNCINLPETIWLRIFSYYMPKRITLGHSEYDVKLVKMSRRTMQFMLCGDVATWVGHEPTSAYVRFTKTTLELFLIPNMDK